MKSRRAAPRCKLLAPETIAATFPGSVTSDFPRRSAPYACLPRREGSPARRPGILSAMLLLSVFAVAPAQAQVCALEDAPVTAVDALELLKAAVGMAELPACSAGGLPATGATACYDADGAEIDCEGTGQDGDLRSGIARSFTNHGDGTITDDVTGLTWEAKCDGWSCPELHDKDTEYTWSDAFSRHVATLNAVQFGGFDDWRVPNVLELASLWNVGKSLDEGQTKFVSDDPATFDAFDVCTEPVDPGYQSCTGDEGYWSSTSSAPSPLPQAQTVNYHERGITFSSVYKGQTEKVRAVRGGTAASATSSLPSTDLCVRDGANVTATDALRWLQVAIGLDTPMRCPLGDLPSTGQQTCWDASGAEIGCAGTGQDGDVRAGMSRSFTNHGNGTITDGATGLMWEVKCVGPSCPAIHDEATTYTWQEAFTSHVATLNDTAFAGYDDWRVPNANELLSLWNPGKDAMQQPAAFDAFDTCASDCDVTTCSCSAVGGGQFEYWSSDTAYRFVNGQGDRPISAFTLDLGPFDGVGPRDKHQQAQVRAVRGGN